MLRKRQRVFANILMVIFLRIFTVQHGLLAELAEISACTHGHEFASF